MFRHVHDVTVKFKCHSEKAVNILCIVVAAIYCSIDSTATVELR